MQNMENDIQITVENTRATKIDEAWDPMREEYENAQLNCYDHGPGHNLDINLQRPAHRDANNQVVYKIFVRKIPRGLTKSGLEHLLMNFGNPNVTKCWMDSRSNNLDWALVEFKFLQEALNAIVGLDKNPPLNMEVVFAKSDEENARRRKLQKEEEQKYREWTKEYELQKSQPGPSSNENQAPALANRNVLKSFGRGHRGRFIVNAYRDNCVRRAGLKNCAWSNGIPDFRDSSGLMYDPNLNRHNASNNFLQNLVVSTTNTVRRVTMGRGYVPPEKGQAPCIPTDCVTERKLGSDVQVPLLTCKKCGAESIQKCSQCGTPYCSRKCQKEDYIRHKPECVPKVSIDQFENFNSEGTQKYVPVCHQTETVQKAQPMFAYSTKPNNPFWGKPAQSVVELLAEDARAIFNISSESEGQFHGPLSCKEVFDIMEKLFTLGSFLHRTPQNSSFWPSTGSLVGVNNEGSSWRGYVLNTPVCGVSSIFLIALCELGKVEEIDSSNIFPLPSDFYSLPELAVTCNIVSLSPQASATLERERSMCLKVKNSSNEGVKAEIVVDDTEEVIGLVNICRYVPNIDRMLTPIQLVPPCPVIVSAYHHQHAIYVRPVGKPYGEQMFSLLQQVAAVVVQSTPLSRPPYKDEMVACLFKKDGNYYRAIVHDAQSAEEYSVFFVDFGNLASARIEDMKALPPELKLSPCMAVKVSLTGVMDGPLNEDAIKYLNMVVQKELQLRLECQSRSNEGVELFLPDNRSFNSELQTFLLPEWKHSVTNGKDPFNGTVFMVENMEVLPLLQGGLKRGSTSVFVHTVMVDGRVAVIPIDRPEVEHVLQTLTFQIAEYCESTDANSSYNPRDSELCLAKYKGDGCWHRGVNTKTMQESQSCHILFLDYGNVEDVELKNIRRMVPDFMGTPTVMSMCELDGVPNEPTPDVVRRLKEIIMANKAYDIDVLSMIGKGQYRISIPEISKQLKSELSTQS